MIVRSRTQSFFKLYFAKGDCEPSQRIYIYYDRRPLSLPATFEKDRYHFRLPRVLEDKMMAGDLVADFSYTELPPQMGVSKRMNTPFSIILSDRYK
jgi:hypothetical protein